MTAILNIVDSLAVPCDEGFTSKCLCGNIEYQGKVQYVVNCTNTNFQNATVLQNLPSKTQVCLNHYILAKSSLVLFSKYFTVAFHSSGLMSRVEEAKSKQ